MKAMEKLQNALFGASQDFMQSIKKQTEWKNSDIDNIFLIDIASATKKLIYVDKIFSIIAIMGRNRESPISLFEAILSTPKIVNLFDENIIKDIWDKFELFDTPEIVQRVSRFKMRNFPKMNHLILLITEEPSGLNNIRLCFRVE